MATVHCARCGQTNEGLALKPPGKHGLLVQQRVCEACWNDWRAMVPRIINHYGLNLGDPDDRAQLQEAMLQYFTLQDAAESGPPNQ